MIAPRRAARVLSFRDRLSRLNFLQACKLFEGDGAALIRAGGKYEIRVDTQVSLGEDRLLLRLAGAEASIRLCDRSRHHLRLECSTCDGDCEHLGAAVSLVLEEKMALGLSARPRGELPPELLTEEELIERAIADREQRSRKEHMRVKAVEARKLWTDYLVTNVESGRTYRVALRGWERGDSYCSCPDFRKNTLGLCKHILNVQRKARRRFSASTCGRPFRQKELAVHLRYGEELELRLLLPEEVPPEVKKAIGPLRSRPVDDARDLLRRLRKLEALGHEVMIYPDAEEHIDRLLLRERIESAVEEIRRDPARHALRRGLLKTELLPYQLDGIAFAVGAGRAVLADDMGLGKTIQAIGVAELLAGLAGIGKVLIVCPASLKSQWRAEIERFSARSCQIVLGSARERARQYGNEHFFSICNYEQVLRDAVPIRQMRWDLIVLDEGQRIKNWEAKTSRAIKDLESPFALVLSGTPLENRLDDLFSVVEFIDDRRLGPAFRFFHRHRVVDERGKVLGYRNLDELRERLAPVLLRRTRDSVLQQLPPRLTEVIRVTPHAQQMDIHRGHMLTVQTIINKDYVTEMDLLRLQKALLMCRLVANSTFLVDKRAPGYSRKLEELDNLLEQLSREEGSKIVLFSEWTTMLDLIQPLLRRHGVEFVRLDGSVPQKKRGALVRRFETDGDCRAFISTNAGSTGLNLQAANVIVNVDLPWNPAILEQRISRAHRMGQKNPVRVFLLVSDGTIEENLLGTLSAKHELFLAALDPESEVDAVDLQSGVEELKRRLEILLGKKPEAPLDEMQRQSREREAEQLAERRERVASAGGQLLTAALSFLGELAGEPEDRAATGELARRLRESLTECVEKEADGGLALRLKLPEAGALDPLADSLARVLASRGNGSG